MFRKLVKNRRAQNTAEYALLIALVVAAIVAMQSYAQRALQARVRDASRFLVDQTSAIGTTDHYESYITNRDFVVVRNQEETQQLGSNKVGIETVTKRTRLGSEQLDYINRVVNGI